MEKDPRGKEGIANLHKHENARKYGMIDIPADPCMRSAIADDVDEFEDREIDNIELYQSFKALAARTRNEHAVEIEVPNDFGIGAPGRSLMRGPTGRKHDCYPY